MLYGLDLFSGIGGISEALKDYVRPVCYCENDPYAAGVLFSRMLDGSISRAPIFPDVRRLNKKILGRCADEWANNLVETVSDDEWFAIYEGQVPADVLAYGFLAGYKAAMEEIEKRERK
jgi:site-specific DNA-cytosine methylase